MTATAPTTKSVLKTKSPAVPESIGWMNVLHASVLMKARDPPIHNGLIDQYMTVAIDAGRRPKARLTHSNNPPSSGNALPSSAVTRP
ncbi:Uncharacterised protein [Mycobacteroides abscessus subsp. abscessus]|nr:Uncharacterised protein [Mycobacteroides abscessus subsp. abscessus]